MLACWASYVVAWFCTPVCLLRRPSFSPCTGWALQPAYSGDDVLPQLLCQERLLKAVADGWVPFVLLLRGVRRLEPDDAAEQPAGVTARTDASGSSPQPVEELEIVKEVGEALSLSRPVQIAIAEILPRQLPARANQPTLTLEVHHRGVQVCNLRQRWLPTHDHDSTDLPRGSCGNAGMTCTEHTPCLHAASVSRD